MNSLFWCLPQIFLSWEPVTQQWERPVREAAAAVSHGLLDDTGIKVRYSTHECAMFKRCFFCGQKRVFVGYGHPGPGHPLSLMDWWPSPDGWASSCFGHVLLFQGVSKPTRQHAYGVHCLDSVFFQNMSMFDLFIFSVSVMCIDIYIYIYNIYIDSYRVSDWWF